MSRSVRSPLLALLVVAGGCVAGEETRGVGSRRAAILNGLPNPGDPSVVFLVVGDGMCTGSVIDPFVILTARHCVAGIDPLTVEVFTGADPLRGDGDLVAWRGQIVDSAVPSDEGDIAVLMSGVELGLAALPYSNDLTNPAIGNAVIAIGYGQGDDYGGEGTKRRGQGTVQDVFLDGFLTTAVTCFGDSGGPIFDQAGTIVGVVSAGTADTCSSGQDFDVNVGYYADFLDDAIGLPDPEPDPDPQPDPDPRPDPDPGLGILGDACSEAAECASNACVVGDGYCTEPCAGDECPDGYECRGASGELFCVLPGSSGGGGRSRSSCSAAGGPGATSPLVSLAGALAALLTCRRRARAASGRPRP